MVGRKTSVNDRAASCLLAYAWFAVVLVCQKLPMGEAVIPLPRSSILMAGCSGSHDVEWPS